MKKLSWIWVFAALVLGFASGWGLHPSDTDGTAEPSPAFDLVIKRARTLSGRIVNVWIDDGHVVRVTERGGIERVRAERVIEADGALLLGGVHDHHAHIFLGGTGFTALQLGGYDSVETLERGIADWASTHPDDPWILGRGWRYSLFPGGLPHRDRLDALVPDRPVALKGYDGHASWTNSLALERANITRDTPDPPEGKIVRGPDGEPTGVLLESAEKLVTAVIPSPTAAEQREVLASALQHVLSRGITEIDDMVYRDPAERISLYRALQSEGRLPLRVRVFPVVPADVSDRTLDVISDLKRELEGNPRLSVPGIKLFLDGVIESKTAFMKAPFATGGGRGEPRVKPARLGEILVASAARELAVVMHAVGDAAVAMALDEIEKLGDVRPPLLRLEHLEIVDPVDRPRLASLDVEASMQPYHADPGGPVPNAGVWARNLGAERLPLTFPWQSLLQAGVTLRFGSDWPVVSVDPLSGLAVALSRQNRKGQPEGGWVPGERIGLEAAIDAYDARPRLEPGASVDLVLYDPGLRPHVPASLWQHSRGEGVRWVLIDREVYRF